MFIVEQSQHTWLTITLHKPGFALKNKKLSGWQATFIHTWNTNYLSFTIFSLYSYYIRKFPNKFWPCFIILFLLIFALASLASCVMLAWWLLSIGVILISVFFLCCKRCHFVVMLFTVIYMYLFSLRLFKKEIECCRNMNRHVRSTRRHIGSLLLYYSYFIAIMIYNHAFWSQKVPTNKHSKPGFFLNHSHNAIQIPPPPPQSCHTRQLCSETPLCESLLPVPSFPSFSLAPSIHPSPIAPQGKALTEEHPIHLSPC